MIGMTSAKVAISVPTEVLEMARRGVKRGGATSLSAYVTMALEEMAQFDDLDAELDEMLEESGGPMTEEVRARLEAFFDNLPPLD